MDYTVAEYSVIGGKKKKKKKKKKRATSKANISGVGIAEELKPIAEEPGKPNIIQTKQAPSQPPREELQMPLV